MFGSSAAAVNDMDKRRKSQPRRLNSEPNVDDV